MIMRISLRQVAVIAAIGAALISGCSDTPESMVVSAKQFLAKNENKSAVIQLKNALQKNPDLAEARFLLGKALLETGDLLGAEKELRKALELKYSSEEVIPPLARTLTSLGQYQQLTNEFSKVELRATAGNAELHAALGDAYLGLGNVSAARDAFAAALAAQPKYMPAHLGQARIAAGTGDLPKALEIIDAVLTDSPTPAGWQLKGDILAAQGQTESALAAYRKAVEIKRDFFPAHSTMLRILLEHSRLDEATKQLEIMKEIAPKHPITFYLQALLAYRQKDFIQAREAIQQQMRVAPDYLPGLVLAGAIEFQLKSYAQAETFLQKVLLRAPNQPLARRMLIGIYLRNGQASKALNVLTPVLDHIDRDPSMLALAGEVYMSNGEAERASEYFAKATALDPGDPRKGAALGLSQLARGETDKGFKQLEQTAAIDSGIRADLVLIAAHMRRREFDAALASIAKLEKKQPDSPLTHAMRATALLGKNDGTAARAALERALQLDPTYFAAAAMLAKLDLAEKKPESALRRFDSVLATQPQHLQALLAQAEIRAMTHGKPDEVVAPLKKAITAHPMNPAPRLAMIEYYLGANDAKKAVGAARDALAAIPDRPEILDAAGRAYRAVGDTSQALSMYSKFALLQPKSPLPYLRMAGVQVQAKDKEGAMGNLRRALSIQSDLLEAQRNIIALNIEAGRVREALATAKEVQKQRPKQEVGYLLEGDIHAAAKNWGEALRVYRAALERSPSSDVAVRLHGTLGASGAKADAEHFATGWLKDHSKDNTFRLHLAQAALTKQDYTAAAKHYRTLVDSQPQNALLLNNLAWAEGRIKDPAAIEHAEKANQLAPNQPAIMDTLGVLLIERGDTVRGVALLEKASALAPQAPSIRLNFARGLIKVGKKDAARKELDELAKLGDKFPDQAAVAQLKREL